MMDTGNSPTPAALLAWQIAAVEARYLGAGYIEPEHIFIGLLSLDKILKQKDALNVEQAMAGVREEWEAIAALLDLTGHDPVVLRRLTRAALPHDRSGDDRTIIHRSPACHALFFRAARLAGSRPLTANDLFSAMMEQPGDVISGVLAEGRRCVAAERETDILLPTATRLAAAGGSSGLAGKPALTRFVGRYRDTLVRWRPVSYEYAVTRDAVNLTAACLARIHLKQQDLAGIVSALRQVVARSEDEAAKIARIITAAEQVEREGGHLPEEIARLLSDLLDDLDRDGSGPASPPVPPAPPRL
jgi:hypothetical protein